MARDFDGTDDVVRVAVAVVTAPPFTMACWFNDDIATQQDCLISIGDTAASATDGHFLQADGAAAGDPISVGSRSGGATNAAVTTTGFTAGTWFHACGVWATTTDRRAFINGGSKGTNVSESLPTGLDATGIGRRERGTSDNFFAGLIADAAIWNVALTDDEVLMLANGLSPLALRPGNLVWYLPLFGTTDPEPDWTGANNHGTVTGTTRADHPPKIAAVWIGGRPRAVQFAPPAAFIPEEEYADVVSPFPLEPLVSVW